MPANPSTPEVTGADEARRLIEKLAAADIDVSGTAAIGITSADIIDANGWLAVERVASTDMAGALPADVRRLIIAAREVTDRGTDDAETRELLDAVEAFSSRVPYEDEPDDIAEAPPVEGLTSGDQASIPMILHCPRCHVQHVDEPTPEWDNPPHRSHLCLACGCIWRPADVPTQGVSSIATVGKADTPLTPVEGLTSGGGLRIAVAEVLNAAWSLCDDTAEGDSDKPEVPRAAWKRLSDALDALEPLIPQREQPCWPGVAARLLAGYDPAVSGLQPVPGHAEGCGAHDDYDCDCVASPKATATAPYLSDRFEWAAPGDQQEDAWIVRFCDQDVRDALYTGPDAEAEARAAWDRHAPGYNMYLFRLAKLDPQATATASVREWAALAGHVRGIATVIRAFPNDKAWGGVDQAGGAAQILDRAATALALQDSGTVDTHAGSGEVGR